MDEKIICNALYRHLIKDEYYPAIRFVTNEECDHLFAGYDMAEVEMAILQPFYFRKPFLEKLPALKIAQITGAGYDAVEIEELRKKQVVLCNTRGVMSVSIAEDVFAKLLFFTRKLRVVEQDRQEHKWDTFGQNQWMCTCYEDVYGKTLGIMGCGSIGTEIAKRAKAFGMQVNVFAPSKKENAYVDKWYSGEEALKAFYKTCDYIVVSMPLKDSTRHMISKEAFREMKQSAIFINIARGPIVDTDALLYALETHEIRAAALDVFEQEPLPPDSPMWEAPNLLLTSHKAGMGDSWKGFIGSLIMRNIDHYQKGEPLENRIQYE